MIITAHHRLERVHGLPGLAQITDQPGGDEGLADVGAGRGDEIGGHVLRLFRFAHDLIRKPVPTFRDHARTKILLRTISARRVIASSGCCAVNVSRKRAVPSGTEGGRMAAARKPSSASRREAASVASSSPIITGTIGLCASGRPTAFVKAFAFCTGRAA